MNYRTIYNYISLYYIRFGLPRSPFRYSVQSLLTQPLGVQRLCGNSLSSSIPAPLFLHCLGDASFFSLFSGSTSEGRVSSSQIAYQLYRFNPRFWIVYNYPIFSRCPLLFRSLSQTHSPLSSSKYSIIANKDPQTQQWQSLLNMTTSSR